MSALNCRKAKTARTHCCWMISLAFLRVVRAPRCWDGMGHETVIHFGTRFAAQTRQMAFPTTGPRLCGFLYDVGFSRYVIQTTRAPSRFSEYHMSSECPVRVGLGQPAGGRETKTVRGRGSRYAG
ncbi:hypothetical protein LZ30DRAFT_244584 [Colletotrichum cereale]|nr:hypothetical protein LZ30DRAFT_244584 [Colletotrichum cereale]